MDNHVEVLVETVHAIFPHQHLVHPLDDVLDLDVVGHGQIVAKPKGYWLPTVLFQKISHAFKAVGVIAPAVKNHYLSGQQTILFVNSID